MGGARTAVSTVIKPLADAIQKFKDEATSGKAGPKHSLIRLIQHVDPEVLAYLTARSIFNYNPGRSRLRVTSLATAIGRSVQIEERVQRFEVENPKLCRTVVKDLSTRTGHEGHRVKVMRHILSTHSEEGWGSWTRKEFVHVGLKLLELMEEATQILSLNLIWVGKKKMWVVELSQAFWTWVEQLNDFAELKMPAYMPCIIPPKLTQRPSHSRHPSSAG
jgi:DNA-directed RNA polymerase